jgi:hypothetical protein
LKGYGYGVSGPRVGQRIEAARQLGYDDGYEDGWAAAIDQLLAALAVNGTTDQLSEQVEVRQVG